MEKLILNTPEIEMDDESIYSLMDESVKAYTKRKKLINQTEIPNTTTLKRTIMNSPHNRNALRMIWEESFLHITA